MDMDSYFKNDIFDMKQHCKDLTNVLSGQLEKTYEILKNTVVNKSLR